MLTGPFFEFPKSILWYYLIFSSRSAFRLISSFDGNRPKTAPSHRTSEKRKDDITAGDQIPLLQLIFHLTFFSSLDKFIL